MSHTKAPDYCHTLKGDPYERIEKQSKAEQQAWEKETACKERRANDRQVAGDHYRKLDPHQPWDVLSVWLTPEEYRGWMKGNAIVYLARERDKGGDVDLAKAGHHIEKLLEVIGEQS